MKSIKITTLIAGILILLSSFFHAFLGYPAINDAIITTHTADEVAHTFRIIWIYSSVAMFIIGC